MKQSQRNKLELERKRVAELVALKSEIDQLTATKVSSEEATVLRIEALHEEKAKQHLVRYFLFSVHFSPALR